MSQSRIHDLILLLAGTLLAPACGPEGGNGGSGGPTPENEEALEEALEICKPYARQVSACYTDVDEEVAYVSMVGYCISSFTYAGAEDPGCSEAYAEYFACIGGLDCEVFLGDDDSDDSDGVEEPSAEDPCGPESLRLETECDWGEEVDGASEG